MKIAREGYPLILTAGALAILAFALGWAFIGVVLLCLSLAITGFFRDPVRIVPIGDNLVVSPADGKIVSIGPAPDAELFHGSKTRVSIFLSPLDVHINRIPVAGKISELRYSPGKFLAAYKAEASERNEQNALKVIDSSGRAFGVVQIAGVLARRIVCWVKRGDNLNQGDRFGLIMFGSRTDAYLPDGCSVEVVEGQRVKGGETILGRFL